MGGYLIVCRTPGHAGSEALSAELAQSAQKQGMAFTALNPHTWLAVRGPAPPRCLQVGGWILLGDVFNRRSPVLPVTGPADPWGYERKLIARFWGRFIGVLFGENDQLACVLRDPSGAYECVTWTQDGLTLVCSSADDWLIGRLRPPWRINVERLHQALYCLVTGTGELLLDGPTALEPGTLQPFPLTRHAEAIWRPADVARRSLEAAPSPDEAGEQIRSAIDEAVAGLSSLPGPLAAEVSGGLDSSIVASSLVRHAPEGVHLWLNAYGATPESDERTYVEALGRVLGFDPSVVPHATGVMNDDWRRAMSGDFRPGLNALDHPQDRAWAGRISDAGAVAVMTGKGGDSILFQAATTDVFTDLWQARGWRALGYPDLTELAAGNEISVWTMIRAAWRRPFATSDALMRDHPLLSPLREDAAVHPWLVDLEDFGPSKVFHIAGVADSVSHHGPSCLNRTIDVRHPLCAQPVIEACLALPTSLLTIGGRDRGLARRAFRERLPAAVVDRRSKGEMTRIYGRMILDNLHFLRPWLIDGRLAALGVINRQAAEIELTPEALIWRGHYAVILTAAALEGWVRLWEDRLGPAS